MKYYGKIKPLRTEREFLAKTDWVKAFRKATAKRGMKTGVELFHAWIDPSRFAKELPDSIQINVFGKPVITHNYKIRPFVTTVLLSRSTPLAFIRTWLQIMIWTTSKPV